MQSGNTLGVFQIESSMFQGINKRMRPSTFEDIIAIIALGRPGPLESGMVSDFIDRKHGKAPIVYMFPELEPILRPTYGTIVYQEQVMQIVQKIGGFSLGEADLIRRAMGKKDAKLWQTIKANSPKVRLHKDLIEPKRRNYGNSLLNLQAMDLTNPILPLMLW